MAQVVNIPARLAALTKQLNDLSELLNNPQTGLSVLRQVANAAMPKSGGTFTGPIAVMTPTDAGNPLQYSSLPLSMTFTQALPLIALGTTFPSTWWCPTQP